MNYRKIMAFALASAISVSTLAAPVFAADTDTVSETTTTESQTEQEEIQEESKSQAGQEAQKESGNQNDQQVQEENGAQAGQKGQGTQQKQGTRGGKGGCHGKKGAIQEVAEPEGAVGKDAAKTKALEDAGVTADKAGKVMAFVSQLEDGTVVYKVRFTCDSTRYSYTINALTCDIVDKNSSAVTEGSGQKTGKKGHMQEAAEPEGAIGKDAAKTKALEDAGVTAEKAGRIMAFASQLEDGTVVYKVRFTYDGTRYSYRINALTGEVVEKKTGEASQRQTEKTGSKASDSEATTENSGDTVY